LPEDEIDTKLDFNIYSADDDFSKLDFRYNGTDELEVDAYIHGNPTNNIDNHVSTIYSVRYESNLIGFFTLSMSSIGKDKMLEDDFLDVIYGTYPALLLGQMGLDVNYRSGVIGKKICSYCRGIGQELNEKSACAFLILQTTPTLARKFYEPDCHFKWKANDNKKRVWMYRKLF
jgi:hypothetical protein